MLSNLPRITEKVLELESNSDNLAPPCSSPSQGQTLIICVVSGMVLSLSMPHLLNGNNCTWLNYDTFVGWLKGLTKMTTVFFSAQYWAHSKRSTKATDYL